MDSSKPHNFGMLMTPVCLSEKRIRASLEKLVKSRQTSAQGRLDGFFKVVEKRPVQNLAHLGEKVFY
jgi:hypothetical protein